MSEQENRQKIYNNILKLKSNIKNPSFQLIDFLNFMDYQISQQFSKFSFLAICGSRKSFQIPSRFEIAFNSMNFSEKLEYYQKCVNHSLLIQKNIQNNLETKTEKKQNEGKNVLKLFIQQKAGWVEKELIIQNYQTNIKSEVIDLKNYLLRNSKKKSRKCLVLQSIIKSHHEIIRISFSDDVQQQKNKLNFIQIMNESNYRFIEMLSSRKLLKKKSRQVIIQPNNKQHFLHVQNNKNELGVEFKKNLKSNQSIVSEILKYEHYEDFDQNLPEIIDEQNQIQIILSQINKNNNLEVSNSRQQPLQIKYPNVFARIMPNYNLKTLSDLSNFQPIYKNFLTNLFIYKSTQNQQTYKFEITTQLNAETLVNLICNVNNYKVWHNEVLEGQMKMMISSQNTAIMYQKNKRYGEWYKQRDFIYIRHLFRFQKKYYIADKSIQNTNFMPFNSIVRGKINFAIWQISQHQKGSTLIGEIQMDHIGLTHFKRQQLTLRYLSGLENLNKNVIHQSLKNKLKLGFKLHWTIDGYENPIINVNLISIKTADFQGESQISEEDVFYTISNASIEKDCIEEQTSQHEIQIDKEKEKSHQNYFKLYDQEIHLDQNGLCVYPKRYLDKKHLQSPMQIPISAITLKYQNILLKNDWFHLAEGGFKLINKQKIQAQNNVFKFMMKTLKNNFFSGKGLTGISLPVQIFNTDSNLQRLALGLGMAPYFLEKAYKSQTIVDRMKYILAFGLSNLLLCLDIEKPFNPILGETYQGDIAGCPVYGQQIMHHPPISSIYFIGRGYKIYGNLELKGQLHMNSGTGSNNGLWTIEFKDGQKVEFQTATWELSGLTVGEQKMGLKKKSYFIDRENQLYCEMKFEEQTGFFSKNNWKYNDQIQGELVKVNSAFIKKFAEQPCKVSPTNTQILQRYYKLEGRWPIHLIVDGQIIYKINQHLPFEVRDYGFPLNSNSNYREDILYRKKGDIARCQIQKDRLEALQRADRRLREKYLKKN